MDYDSSSKFISSLAKFLQSLCNGYVEFDNGVQVIGHLYLSVDTGTTIDYILNEKVCKTDENSVTFISNSFHAQPAEKPKPPSRRTAKESDRIDSKSEDNADSYSGGQLEPRSTNAGTIPPSGSNQNSHGGKRPHSPSQKQSSKFGRSSPKHKKSRTESQDQNVTSQAPNPASENNISSAPSPAAEGSAQSSDTAPYNESYQQSFFHLDEENSIADESEERDIKPSIDTDVTFIKEEYAPSSSCAQSSSQGRDRGHGEDSSLYPYQSNQVFPGGFTSQGGFGASPSGTQRTNFSASGDRSSHMFGTGQGSSQVEGGEGSGDPSGAWWDEQASVRSSLLPPLTSSTLDAVLVSVCQAGPILPSAAATAPRSLGPPFACGTCTKVFISRAHMLKHRHFCRGGRVVMCSECGKTFGRRYNLRVHMRNIHGIGETIVCKACGLTFRSYIKLNEHTRACRLAQN